MQGADVDGDGTRDVVVGIPRQDAVLVIFLDGSGQARGGQLAKASERGYGLSYNTFGSSVGSLGDVSGDGRVDLVVVDEAQGQVSVVRVGVRPSPSPVSTFVRV